jgi:hypothetical protein
MAGKSIYPSIPSSGNDIPSIQAAMTAMRQTMTMVIMNAQTPDPNYTPSSAAQVFVTNAQLSTALGKNAVGAAAAPAFARATLARGVPARATPLPIQVVSTRLP